MAQKAKAYGYHTVVMQSGEDMHFSVHVLTPILREIKKLDLAITLSIGERSFEEYKAFREAGADRYLLRIETTDKELYERMDPGMSFENRLRCLRDLRTLGYEVGTGSLIGLPGQTLDRVQVFDRVGYAGQRQPLSGRDPLVGAPCVRHGPFGREAGEGSVLVTLFRDSKGHLGDFDR